MKTQDKIKKNKIENDGVKTSVNTYGGYSYSIDYRASDEDYAYDERKGLYSVILATLLFVTVGVLCIAAVIITGAVRQGVPSKKGTNNGLLAVTDAMSEASADTAKAYTPDQIADNCSVFTVSVCAERNGAVEYGTGVVITTDGYIVTTNKVVGSYDSVQAILPNGKKYDARVIGQDKTGEIAVIKINESGLSPASFDIEESAKEGEIVTALPFVPDDCSDKNISSGKIYASQFVFTKYSGTDNEKKFRVISTDIVHEKEMCGAPLINGEGRIIGIMFDCGSQKEESYAIPAESILSIIRNIIGAYKSDFGVEVVSGLVCSDITEDIANKYNLPRGVLVSGVQSDSQAAFAGVEKGDIIISFDCVSVKSTAELQKELSYHTHSDVVTVKVYRKGTLLEFTFMI